MDSPGFNFFRSTLARQTFLLFVVSAVLPVVFIGILSSEHVSSQLREQSYEQSRQAGKAIAMELLNHLLLLSDDLVGVAEVLRNNPERSPQRSPVPPASRFAAFAAISLLVDGEAPLLLRGKLDYIPRLSGAEKAHLASGQSLLRLLPGDQGGADILLMRLLDPGKPVDGVLIGKLSDADIRALENLLPPTTGLQLFGPENHLLYASAGLNLDVTASLKQQVSTAISGHFKWRSGNVNYLASYWSLFAEPEFMLPYLVVVVSQTETCEQLRKFADHVAVALSNARWEERLYHQAHYDTLTNLPNRALLKDRLEQAIARAQRNQDSVGVMFIDLDRFKLVNDSLGHGAGDRLLQNIAELLLQCVRSVDTVVRFGGDEFVVIIPDIHQRDDVVGQLGIIARKILGSAGEEMVLGDHSVRAEASIGIALYPKDAQTADELVKHADTAMYHAKDQGRGCYRFFAPELNITATRRLNTEQELRHALQNNDFRVYYQPKYDCLSGTLCGAEALIRWQHPHKGLIVPGEFISVAEETGQIQQIGAWVLRSICEQIMTWRDAGLPMVRIAVNLSPRQFRDADVSAMVAQMPEKCGLDGSAIELEVTEGSVMENSAESIDKLRRLHSTGVHISVDDFGTGYSSLNYLRTLPIDTLKIDRSFVVQMLEDDRAGAIVSTIITLAHNLGLEVVAEGVENQQQKRQLQTLHCDVCQGYLYSPPLPTDKFTAILEKHRQTDTVDGQDDTGKNRAKRQ